MAHEYHGVIDMMLHGLTSLPFWLALAGAVTAWYLYIVNPALPGVLRQKFSFVVNILMEKYGCDRFNQWFFAGGARAIGGGLWKFGDVAIIDGFMVNGTARVVGWIGGMVRLFQSGYIYHYAFTMIIGVFVLLTLWLATLVSWPRLRQIVKISKQGNAACAGDIRPEGSPLGQGARSPFVRSGFSASRILCLPFGLSRLRSLTSAPWLSLTIWIPIAWRRGARVRRPSCRDGAPDRADRRGARPRREPAALHRIQHADERDAVRRTRALDPALQHQLQPRRGRHFGAVHPAEQLYHRAGGDCGLGSRSRSAWRSTWRPS